MVHFNVFVYGTVNCGQKRTMFKIKSPQEKYKPGEGKHIPLNSQREYQMTMRISPHLFVKDKMQSIVLCLKLKAAV